MKKVLSSLIVSLLLIVIVGCTPQATEVTGAEREAVLAFSEASTDNLLAALNAYDYAAFSRDFDAEMLAAMPESEFNSLKVESDKTLGLYRSRTVNSVLLQEGFYIVVYTATFEKQESITMRVVFRVEEPHPISGLWFDE